MLIYGQMVPFIGGVILVTNILVVITDDLFFVKWFFDDRKRGSHFSGQMSDLIMIKWLSKSGSISPFPLLIREMSEDYPKCQKSGDISPAFVCLTSWWLIFSLKFALLTCFMTLLLFFCFFWCKGVYPLTLYACERSRRGVYCTVCHL